MPEDRPDAEACPFVAGQAGLASWSDVQADAWIGLLETHKRLTRALEAELEARHGLSLSSVELLGRLAAAEGHRLRLSRLAAEAGLSLSRVSRIVDMLQARGLVRREVCPSDARAVEAHLGDAGLVLAREAQATHVASVRERFLDRLGPGEAEALAEVFRRFAPRARRPAPKRHKQVPCRHREVRWTPGRSGGMHCLVFGFDRDRAVAGAQLILDQGGWCVLEVCVNVPAQRWDAALVIFDLSAEAVADVLVTELVSDPGRDVRLTGCDRATLQPRRALGTYLCYLAPTGPEAPRSGMKGDATSTGRHPMLVRDGMNPIVVTVGPDHTVREAARRMTAHGVGAAVVIDEQAPGPGIITERDVLHADGVGQDIDVELVRAHLTSEVVFAAASWSLEQAAAAMIRGGFRHIIVLDGSDVSGILSMRDIVRCWVSDGAACDFNGGSPAAPGARA